MNSRLGWYSIDEIVQTGGNTKSVLRPLKRLLKHIPKGMIIDKLGSYGAAHRQIMSNVEYRPHKDLNSNTITCATD